jgi:hypothetical protein
LISWLAAVICKLLHTSFVSNVSPNIILNCGIRTGVSENYHVIYIRRTETCCSDIFHCKFSDCHLGHKEPTTIVLKWKYHQRCEIIYNRCNDVATEEKYIIGLTAGVAAPAYL